MRTSGNRLIGGCNRPAPIRCALALTLCWVCAPLAAAQLERHEVTDLDYGRSLFQFFQGNELAAITRLMIAEQNPRERPQRDESRLLLADLYYGYGLYQDSRKLFAQLLETEVSDSIQNRIWFNLARLRYEQGYHDHARDLLSRINARLPGFIESERKYLLTNLYLGIRQYQQARELSGQIDPDSIWSVYARYNLAVSMLEDGRYPEGKPLLEKIGRIKSANPEMLALRDRANLSLGLKQLRTGLHESAIDSLSRVRLQGPLSHQALLATGWTRYRLNQFEKAMVLWRLLLRRNAIDAATQEAILAIPAGYAESGQDKLAIRHYEVAALQFDAQLLLLDNAIATIDDNGLVDALREHQVLNDRESIERLPPDSTVTPQLHQLLASTEFQHEVKRYQELLDIRASLHHWENNIPVLELMLEERRRTFEQKLPMLRQTTSFDQLEMLGERRDRYAGQIAKIDLDEDFAALASADEKEQLERLQRVSESIEKIKTHRSATYQQYMLRLLSGVLHYQMANEYPARIWKAKKQLILLDRELEIAENRVTSLRGIVERGNGEFEGFATRIGGQMENIRNLDERVTRLLRQQEGLINRMAIEAIHQQQQHIVQLRLNARFELARLYDKMAKQQ